MESDRMSLGTVDGSIQATGVEGFQVVLSGSPAPDIENPPGQSAGSFSSRHQSLPRQSTGVVAETSMTAAPNQSSDGLRSSEGRMSSTRYSTVDPSGPSQSTSGLQSAKFETSDPGRLSLSNNGGMYLQDRLPESYSPADSNRSSKSEVGGGSLEVEILPEADTSEGVRCDGKRQGQGICRNDADSDVAKCVKRRRVASCTTSASESKERASTEASQQNKNRDPLVKRDANVKRVKLTPLSDTTLQDLPYELIECILIKAVVMEVKSLNVAKGVWKEKADLVISRLRTVCSQWSSILTTNFFRNELHRTLDGSVESRIRLEVLHEMPLRYSESKLASMNDDIFTLGQSEGGQAGISIYDRNNMAEVKDVILLPKQLHPETIVTCSVSNCVYVLGKKCTGKYNIYRVSNTDDSPYAVESFIVDIPVSEPVFAADVHGNLILSRQKVSALCNASIYTRNGFLKGKLKLPLNMKNLTKLLPKANGNLVLVSTDDGIHSHLTEIDLTGIVIRRRMSALCAHKRAVNAGNGGNILLVDRQNRMELYDSEFTLLHFIGHQLGLRQVISSEINFNSERNEIVSKITDPNHPHGLLTIFQLTEG